MDHTWHNSIDKVIHEPARLHMLACLYVVESADFVYLQRRTGLTGGNISSHMSKLEDAGYINVLKTFVGKRPNTSFQLTPAGREALEAYSGRMKKLLDDMTR